MVVVVVVATTTTAQLHDLNITNESNNLTVTVIIGGNNMKTQQLQL